MEPFRKKIKSRIVALAILAFISIAIEFVDVFWVQEVLKDNLVSCFQCGLAAGATIMSLMLILRYSRALRDNNKLEILYNKENDERMKYIRAKAGFPLLWVTSVVMMLAGIIIGYFNTVVFYTLIATAALQLIVACVTKFVYMKIS